MAAPKERFSPDNSSGDQPSKKRPGSPERRGGSSTDFEEVQHEKLLEMGLSFRRIVERTSEYAIFALELALLEYTPTLSFFASYTAPAIGERPDCRDSRLPSGEKDRKKRLPADAC